MTRPPGLPIPAIAQLGLFLAKPVDFIERVHKRYGDIVWIRSPIFGNEIVITRPESIREVFRGPPDTFLGGEANEALSILVGPASVLVLDGKPHRRQRKLLMPPFHGERMRSYTEVMAAEAQRGIEKMPFSVPTPILPIVQRVTLDVIMRTVFGMREGRDLDELRGALESLIVGPTSAIGMLPMIPALQRDLGPWWPYGQFIRQRQATDEMIHAQIERARAGSGDGEDVLTLLLAARDEDGEPMTDGELRDELVTLLLAGHETTALTLSWCVEQILLHRDVFRRVREELDEVVGDGDVEIEHVPALTYLDATIKEVLRLRPIIPFFARRLAKPIRLQGYDIPAGDMIAPSSWMVHRDPDVYPDPERFDPERFIDRKPDHAAWIPFGGGNRRCIGMAFAMHEIKVVLATMFSQLDLTLVNPRPAAIKMRGFSFSPRGGTPVIARSRKRRGVSHVRTTRASA